MSLPPSSQRGIALLQVAIIMVIMSSLFALISPLLKMTIKKNKHVDERMMMNEASRALIGYAFIHGGLPSPSAENTLPTSLLGLPTLGPYTKPFAYEVNAALTETATGGDISVFCQAVFTESSNSSLPMTWHARDYTDTLNTTPVPFAILARGENQQFDGQNTPVGTDGDQIYENSGTGWQGTYDDSVVTHSFDQLCQRCDKLAIVCAGG